MAHIACVGLAHHRPHLQAVRLRAIQMIARPRWCEELHGSERICSLPGGSSRSAVRATKAGDSVHTALAVRVLYEHGRRVGGATTAVFSWSAVHHSACVAVAARVQPCVDRIAHIDGVTRAVLDAACLELEQLWRERIRRGLLVRTSRPTWRCRG